MLTQPTPKYKLGDKVRFQSDRLEVERVITGIRITMDGVLYSVRDSSLEAAEGAVIPIKRVTRDEAVEIAKRTIEPWCSWENNLRQAVHAVFDEIAARGFIKPEGMR